MFWCFGELIQGCAPFVGAYLSRLPGYKSWAETVDVACGGCLPPSVICRRKGEEVLHTFRGGTRTSAGCLWLGFPHGSC